MKKLHLLLILCSLIPTAVQCKTETSNYRFENIDTDYFFQHVDFYKKVRAIIERGAVDELKALIEQGMPVDAEINSTGYRLLHWAALHGQKKIIQFLLEQKSTLKDDASEDEQENISLVDATDNYGQTALHFAAIASHGDPEIIRLLLEAKADPNAETERFKDRPLWWAIYKNNYVATKQLLEAGADHEAKDWFGMDTLTMAKKYKRDESIVQLLQEQAKAKNAETENK